MNFFRNCSIETSIKIQTLPSLIMIALKLNHWSMIVTSLTGSTKISMLRSQSQYQCKHENKPTKKDTIKTHKQEQMKCNTQTPHTWTIPKKNHHPYQPRDHHHPLLLKQSPKNLQLTNNHQYWEKVSAWSKIDQSSHITYQERISTFLFGYSREFSKCNIRRVPPTRIKNTSH